MPVQIRWGRPCDTLRVRLIVDIKDSFLRLPTSVAVWTAAILMPVNMVALFFLGQPFGWLAALLAVGALMANVPIMVRARGLSTAMGAPHVLAWVPLLVLIAFLLLGRNDELSTAFVIYLVVLFVTNAVSLYFDIPDTQRLLKGQETVF